MAKINYYVELNLDRGLSDADLLGELKKKRSALQKKVNMAPDPETESNAQKQLNLMLDAIDVLGDPKKRKAYDKELDKNPDAFSAAKVDPAAATSRVKLDVADMDEAMDLLHEAFVKEDFAFIRKNAPSVIEAGAPNVDVYMWLVFAYADVDKDSQATSTISDMLAAFPENEEAHYWAAYLYLNLFKSKTREARPHIDWLLEHLEKIPGKVAAMDVSYCIAVGDLALAEKKTAEYKKTVGTDKAFTKQVGQAYINVAEGYLQGHGASAYWNSKEDWNNYKKYIELSLSTYPNAQLKRAYESDKKLANGIKFDYSNIVGAVMAVLLGIEFCSAGQFILIAVLCLAAALYIIVFSCVPKWVKYKEECTGELPLQYKIAHWLAVVFAVVWVVIKVVARITYALATGHSVDD